MSIQSYLRIIGARKRLILGVTFAAFVGSALLALIWPNAYESSVRIHVQAVPPAATPVTGESYYSEEYYRQLLAQYNIEDFSEIVQGQAFAASISAIVAERYGLRLTPKVIGDSLRSDHNHRVLELTFTSSEPLVAQALADAAETLLESKAKDYSLAVREGLVSLTIIDPASDPEATSLIRLGLDMFARTLVAFLLITGLAFVLEVLSGICRSREDVEEALSVPVISTIPPIAQNANESGQEVPDQYSESEGTAHA